MPHSFERLSPQGAEKAAPMPARARGLSGVFNRLVQQHREAALLLGHAEAATDPAQRQELWRTLRKELLAHEKAEMIAVYGALDQSATRDIAPRHGEDALALEAAIGAVDLGGYSAPNWADLIRQLRAMLQQHVEEEEHEFFPRALEALGKSAAEELDARYVAVKERELERL